MPFLEVSQARVYYSQLNNALKKASNWLDVQLRRAEILEAAEDERDYTAKAIARIQQFALQVYNQEISDKQAKKLLHDIKNHLKKSALTINYPMELFMQPTMIKSARNKNMWTVAKPNHSYDYILKRQQTEAVLFGGKQDLSKRKTFSCDRFYTEAHSRPHYSALNYSAHPKGGAAGYGAVYFELKDHVSKQSTFTADDSYEMVDVAKTPAELEQVRAKLCTAKNFTKLVSTLSNLHLKNIMPKIGKVNAVDEEPSADDNSPPYIEAQIHADIAWSKDVKAIKIIKDGTFPVKGLSSYSAEEQARIKTNVKEFATLHNITATIVNADGSVAETLHTKKHNSKMKKIAADKYKQWKRKSSAFLAFRCKELKVIDKLFYAFHANCDSYKHKLDVLLSLKSMIVKCKHKNLRSKHLTAVNELMQKVECWKAKIEAELREQIHVDEPQAESKVVITSQEPRPIADLSIESEVIENPSIACSGMR